MESFEELLTASYPWARHYSDYCTSCFSSSFDREELRSVGILGYVVAATRYDDQKGSSFRAFCATRIRGAILDEVRRSTWEPRSARRNQQLIARKKVALEADLQRNATQAELAKALGLDEAELSRLQRLSAPVRYVSLDDESVSNSDTESLALKETLADQTAIAPSDAVSTTEIRRALFTSISKLPSAEGSVIVLFYLRNVPFQDIAQLMKLTPARISQIHHHALASLRKLLGKEGAEALLGRLG